MRVTSFSFFVAALLCCFSNTEAGFWDRVRSFREGRHQQPVKIKVLIERDIGGCMLEVRGRYNIFDPHTGDRVSTRFLPKSNFCQPISEGIRWGEQFPGIYQLHLVPDTADTAISVNGIEYRGSLYVYQVEGTLNLVNELPIEEYVHSILSNQVGDMPSEALAALAISARTEAYNQAFNTCNPYYNVIADEVGYEGHAASLPGSSIAQAMVATRNLILSKTRAFEGALDPVMTECLQGLYGRGESRWDTKKARDLAKEGADAKHIVATMFPEATIELVR